MTDLERFETRLSNWMAARADLAMRPFDAAAVARTAADQPARRQPWRLVGDGRTLAPRSARTFIALLLLAALAGAALIVGSQQPRPSPSPPPPTVFEAVWPGFLVLSSDEAGVSIQVPHWGRAVDVPEGFDLILQAGTGNAGLTVSTPRTPSDLESTVDAILADPGVAAGQPYTRTDVLHGSHRAVRLDSRARADGASIGGHILYIVERPGERPVLVDLAWDSVTDLGYVEEAILRSFNPDGSTPAVLASYPAGSSSFVTMTDTGCSAAGPRLAVTAGTPELTVANQTGHVADLNLLRVGSGYESLADDVRAAAGAIAGGHDPRWENSAGSTWISDVYLQPGSDGALTGEMPPGTYAVMCFPVGEHNESLGVYLTLPFEVEPQGPIEAETSAPPATWAVDRTLDPDGQ